MPEPVRLTIIFYTNPTTTCSADRCLIPASDFGSLALLPSSTVGRRIQSRSTMSVAAVVCDVKSPNLLSCAGLVSGHSAALTWFEGLAVKSAVDGGVGERLLVEVLKKLGLRRDNRFVR